MEIESSSILVQSVVVAKPFVDDKARVIVKLRFRHNHSNYYGLLNALNEGVDTTGLKKRELYAIIHDYDYRCKDAKTLRIGDEVFVDLNGDSIGEIIRHNAFMRKVMLFLSYL